MSALIAWKYRPETARCECRGSSSLSRETLHQHKAFLHRYTVLHGL